MFLILDLGILRLLIYSWSHFNFFEVSLLPDCFIFLPVHRDRSSSKLYKKTGSTSHRKEFHLPYKDLFREVISVDCENGKKEIHFMCRMQSIQASKQVGCIITTGL